MADKFPRPFGRYTLLAPLAQGGMGALYLACVGDRGLERLCVIKTVLPHLADPEYVSRFRDEAKVVVRLSHGNLVPVFDAGMVDGELYLAMDYVEGKDLRAVWNRCAKKGIAFPIDIAVLIVRELARGLHHAHHFGGIRLVHRDVSPPNVLLAFSGEIKLTDFGLASSTLKLEKTAPGIIYGKVSYMSPEQARGEPIDGRTDLYAAGIILWELLTGRQLFPQSEGADLIERVRAPKIEPPSTRAPRVPQGLDSIVMKALAPNADERYPTGEAMRAALAGFLASNRDYVATDGARLSLFMHDLFDEDLERERAQRHELIEHLTERLEENRRIALAERSAAELKVQRKADILAAIERQGREEKGEGVGLREDDLSARVLEQLASNDTEKMIGATIERWKIKRKIGEGGMGRVFEAEHLELGKNVAIKILHPVYRRTPEVVARFRMEARAASRIGHPNIIEVTDSGTTVDGDFYFVMELLEGVDLADTLSRETRLPIEKALGISVQVAQALSAAHQINIIHRDLKPENIYLINKDGHVDFVKVLDFGIAKSLEEEKIKLTTPGMAMGTPEYMAPEQAAGKGCDARSDVYSLGAILYEMLAGRAPIEGENLMEILMRKATEDPGDIRKLRPDAPEEVGKLVMSALSRDPAARPQTMEEFAAALSRCLLHLHGEALGEGHSGGIGLPPLPPRVGEGDAAPHGPQERPAPRSRPGLSVAPSTEDQRELDATRVDTPPQEMDQEAEEERPRLGRQVLWVALLGGLAGVGTALYLVLTAPEDPPTKRVGGPLPVPKEVVVPKATPDMRPAKVEVVQPQPPQPTPPPVRPPPVTIPQPPKLMGGLKLPPPMEINRARAKIEEGRLAINSRNYRTGFTLCYDAAGTPGARGLALTCMGDAEFEQSNYAKAIEYGKLALREKPSKNVYLLLGNAHAKLRNCREAVGYYTKVLTSIDSNNPEAIRGMELCGNR